MGETGTGMDPDLLSPEIGDEKLGAVREVEHDLVVVPYPKVMEGGCKSTDQFDEFSIGKPLPARQLGLKVVVWTVNEPHDITRMIDLGVDGIISDYPDRLRRVATERGLPLPEPTPVVR